jgi:hypothetical protein
MSALGQKQTYAPQKAMCFTPNSDRKSDIPQQAMSALPPKADMCGAVAYVRFGPKADIGPAHSITSGDSEAEHLGGLEVDDELKLR